MISRILVVILFVPILIYVLLVGEKSFLIFNIVVITASLIEFYNMIKKRGYVIYYKTGIFLGILLPLFIYFKNDTSILFKHLNILHRNIPFEMGGFIVFAFFIISIIQITQSRIKNSTSELAYTLFGVIYVSYFLSHMILIVNLPYGRAILLFAFLAIWFSDTFAYIVGSIIGGKIFETKLSKNISPSKSIEGFIGGILGVFLTGFFFEYIYLFLVKVLNVFKMNIKAEYISNLISQNVLKLLMLSVLIAIFSVLGDLFESKLKREYGIKDSSKILLGHGGFLDRFDSSIFVLPLVYYFVKFFIL